MIAYKLCRKKGDKYFPLFINRNRPIPVNEWKEAEFYPTKNYAPRPGWHCSITPYAPHLLKKDGTLSRDRVWLEVEIPDDNDWQDIADSSPTRDLQYNIPFQGHYRFKRSKREGNTWYIAGSIRVIREISDLEVNSINKRQGINTKIKRSLL